MESTLVEMVKSSILVRTGSDQDVKCEKHGKYYRCDFLMPTVPGEFTLPYLVEDIEKIPNISLRRWVFNDIDDLAFSLGL